MLAARSAVFPGPLMDYAAHLERWRDAGTLQGTRGGRAHDHLPRATGTD